MGTVAAVVRLHPVARPLAEAVVVGVGDPLKVVNDVGVAAILILQGREHGVPSSTGEVARLPTRGSISSLPHSLQPTWRRGPGEAVSRPWCWGRATRVVGSAKGCAAGQGWAKLSGECVVFLGVTLKETASDGK
jgi:hypothetical protein